MSNFIFNPNHIHTHFQYAEIKLRIGDAEYGWSKFLSCPKEGLNDEICFQHLSDYYDANLETEFEEIEDGMVWTHQDGVVGIFPKNRNETHSFDSPVYSVDDSEIQVLMKLAPELFSYTTD